MCSIPHENSCHKMFSLCHHSVPSNVALSSLIYVKFICLIYSKHHHQNGSDRQGLITQSAEQT